MFVCIHSFLGAIETKEQKCDNLFSGISLGMMDKMLYQDYEIMKSKHKQLNYLNQQQRECYSLLRRWRLRMMMLCESLEEHKTLDKDLLLIAKKLPTSVIDLLKCCRMPSDLVMARRDEILKCVTRACEKYPNPKQGSIQKRKPQHKRKKTKTTTYKTTT